jgi:uncharacterized membrane protein YdbT with pleckstrin-like domain
MSYAEGLLADGERIERIAHQHWFVMVWNARWAILALLLAILGVVLDVWTGLSGLPSTLMGWIVLALLVVGLASFTWGVFAYRNEEYVITSRRIIHAEGVVNKVASDSSLEKINDAILRESIFGRMFGFGDLEVLTASESGIERLRMLRDAKEFKKAMLDAKHELEIELARPTTPPMRTEPPVAAETPVATAAPAPAPVAPSAPEAMSGDEVAEAVTRLAELRDKGLITPEEYEAKKQELLDRL